MLRHDLARVHPAAVAASCAVARAPVAAAGLATWDRPLARKVLPAKVPPAGRRRDFWLFRGAPKGVILCKLLIYQINFPRQHWQIW